MSKERLEIIKKLREAISEENDFRTRCVLAYVFVNLGYMDWLIEQAERVADYEKRYEKHLDIDIRNDHKIQCLEYQIKRYREALEFYADEDNYREHDLKGIVPPRPIAYKPILHDYGSIARQALECDNE